MAVDPEKRWSWWGQFRDVCASIAGFTLLGVETVRGTYNPLAMLVALICLGIVSSGVLSRYLVGRWENGHDKEK
jgi:hypothetical protein